MAELLADLNWTAISSVATPILVVLLGWFLHQRSERRWKTIEQRWKKEEQLHPDRIRVYREILDPFIVLLSDIDWASAQRTHKEFAGKKQYQVAAAKVLSVDYKRAAFELMVMGTDDVVRAYNALTRYYSRAREWTDEDAAGGLVLFGELVLAIRRSVGNESKGLDARDMLYWGGSEVEGLLVRYRS